MCEISSKIFLEQKVDKKLLENVTRYCNRCYKELKEGENIYYNINNYLHLCKECACEISSEIPNEIEEVLQEKAGLF